MRLLRLREAASGLYLRADASGRAVLADPRAHTAHDAVALDGTEGGGGPGSFTLLHEPAGLAFAVRPPLLLIPPGPNTASAPLRIGSHSAPEESTPWELHPSSAGNGTHELRSGKHVVAHGIEDYLVAVRADGENANAVAFHVEHVDSVRAAFAKPRASAAPSFLYLVQDNGACPANTQPTGETVQLSGGAAPEVLCAGMSPSGPHEPVDKHLAIGRASCAPGYRAIATVEGAILGASAAPDQHEVVVCSAAAAGTSAATESDAAAAQHPAARVRALDTVIVHNQGGPCPGPLAGQHARVPTHHEQGGAVSGAATVCAPHTEASAKRVAASAATSTPPHGSPHLKAWMIALIAVGGVAILAGAVYAWNRQRMRRRTLKTVHPSRVSPWVQGDGDILAASPRAYAAPPR